MKKLIVIIPMLFSLLFVAAQELKVPDAVLEAFETKYPDAGKVTWKIKNDAYQAQFNYESKRLAYFANDGKWLKTATMIDEMDLPENVVEYVMDNYDTADFTQLQYVINNKDQSYYLVIFELDGEKIKLKFDDEGEILQ